jgi:hypothetical protein
MPAATFRESTAAPGWTASWAGHRPQSTVVGPSLTADGADGSHIFVGTRKALTALAFKTSSAKAADMIGADKSLLAQVKANMFVMGGAVPIIQVTRLSRFRPVPAARIFD